MRWFGRTVVSPCPAHPDLRMVSGAPETTQEERLLPSSSYFEPEGKIMTSKWGGEAGEKTTSLHC